MGNMFDFIDKLERKYLGSPRSATSQKWDEWHVTQKKEHPILYFFILTVPEYISSRYYTIARLRISFKSKHSQKNHHIKIDVDRFIEPVNKSSLSSYSWMDSDTKILYSMFQILVDYIEKEKPGESIDWNSDKEHRKAWLEIQKLYEWWIIDRPKREENCNKLLESNHQMDTGFKEYNLAEQKGDNEDTEMLMRLVVIRNYLWT